MSQDLTLPRACYHHFAFLSTLVSRYAPAPTSASGRSGFEEIQVSIYCQTNLDDVAHIGGSRAHHQYVVPICGEDDDG